MSGASGAVYLVGAGPGDPQLISVRGLRLIQRADVVLHDRLVSPALVAEAHPNARIVNVGKGPEKRRFPQSEINRLLVDYARSHQTVVRLKGGDPFIFGLGGDEILALLAADVPFEVVPGVSSVMAAAAYAGIPVTHRGLASSLTVLSGHQLENPEWQHLPRSGTIVVLMGQRKLGRIMSLMIASGRSAETPVAVIGSAATAAQQVRIGTIATIEALAADLQPPALTIVGEVVSLHNTLAWWRGAAESVVWGEARQPI